VIQPFVNILRPLVTAIAEGRPSYLLLGIDVEVDVERHGQRKRCHRQPPRGFAGPAPWCHGMRGGWGGPWGMRGAGRGRFGCTLRGHGVPPPARGHPGPAAATAAEPPPQPMDNADPPASHGDTNVETGEMASGPNEAATAVVDHGWTLVNNGVADVDGATTGVEHLHVAADSAPAENHTADPAVPGVYVCV